MNKAYDVIVIGAGPAGSLAAMKAAQGGAKTLLLEKHRDIGWPVCCAEGITTIGLKRVIEPKPEWISAVIQGANIVGPNGRQVTLTHPEAGYVLDRKAFDSGLAQMAGDHGAELICEAPVVAIKRNDSRINSVIAEIAGQRREIEGKVIIAADGIESRLASMAGINVTLDLTDLDSACQYLVENITFDTEKITIFIGNDIAPGGYAWLFPKGNGRANAGVAFCPSRKRDKTPQQFLDIFLKNRYPEYKCLRVMMGAVPAFQPNLPLVKGNLMIVGDAARVVDSLSGAGISNALISGSIAGEVAAKALTGQASLTDYPKRFMKLKSRELHAYKLFRKLYIRATDEEFDRIVVAIDEFFPEKKVQAVNIPETIFKILLKNPGLVGLARYLISK